MNEPGGTANHGGALDAARVARVDAMPHGRRKSALVDLQEVAARLLAEMGDTGDRPAALAAFATLVDEATSDGPDTARLHEAGERLIDLAKPVGHLATPVAKAVGEVLTASGSLL